MSANKVTFQSKVENGRLNNGDVVKAAINSHEGKTVQITIERLAKPRSLQQNKYMWGVVIPMVAEFFTRCGEPCDKDAAYQFLINNDGNRFNIPFDDLTTPTGNERIAKTSSQWTTEEFESVMFAIRAYFDGYGVYIPHPNDGIVQYEGNLWG